MANHRMAGARTFVRLAAYALLAFSPLAHAGDDPPAFVEYEADSRFSRDPSEAASWGMLAECEWRGLLQCQLLTVRTTSVGYTYTFQHRRERPGGDYEWQSYEGGGTGTYSCPSGYAVYAIAFGMPVGPYANRTMDLGGPFPLICREAMPRSVTGVRRVLPPVIEDGFDDEGRLIRRDIANAKDTAHWQVVYTPGGMQVLGQARDWQTSFLIAGDRVSSTGGGLQFVYGADGSLLRVGAADGTSLVREGAYDPEGRLTARLREIREQLPALPGPEPVATLVRLGKAIDTLFDGESDADMK